MLPRVGQSVLYYPSGQDRFPGSSAPRAAIVAEVNADGRVHLAVFDALGKAHARAFVPFVRPGEPHPECGYCCYPPL